jgi:hypothetical protein
VIFGVIIISIAGPVIGGLAIRRMEQSGKYGVVFMPLVGLAIGVAIHAACGSSGWSGFAAAIIAYLAAMATHVPSAYEMFRQDFGGSPARSLFLSVATSMKYPLIVSGQFAFYFLMLALSIAGAVWSAAK